jgi:hypothetical protein
MSSTYYIRSSSNTAIMYAVTRDRDGTWACECAAYRYHHHDCKHIEQLARGCGLRARPRTEKVGALSDLYRAEVA